ncbi:MAG: SCP2 sterol-binding domain-containing protein [Bacteroidota bacterium]
MNIESLLSIIQAKAAGAETLGNTLKFNLGDQALFLDGTGDSNKVSTEDKEADCTIDVSMEDFQSLLSGDLNPMAAVMGGKVKIKGDMGVAMKLQSLFG